MYGVIMKYCVVLITTKNKDEAKNIAKKILEEHLAACVNIVENISSMYHWENKIVEDNESLMIVKTTKKNFKKLTEVVKSIHSYSSPEIIALPIKDGISSYLKWIDSVVK
jgi:periplasmic divalent cation tolerance protein